MPRPRVPKAKLKATGQDIGTNAANYKDRKEPKSKGPLGKPPKWMKLQSQIDAWESFSDELPWLNHSHRALMEIACNLRGRIIAGEEVGVQALGQLRQCLGQLGATPADASKVNVPDGEDENKDPSDKYF